MKTSTIHEAEDKVQANDSLSTGQDSEGDLSVWQAHILEPGNTSHFRRHRGDGDGLAWAGWGSESLMGLYFETIIQILVRLYIYIYIFEPVWTGENSHQI